jgi:hypothetical protein
MHVCMCTSMREIAGGAVLLSVSGKMLGSRLAARGSEQAQAVRQPELLSDLIQNPYYYTGVM